MPCDKLVDPEISCVGVVPVGVDGIPRPHCPDVDAAVWILEPNIGFGPAGERFVSGYVNTGLPPRWNDLRIRLIVWVGVVESRVHDRDVVTTTPVKLVQEDLGVVVRIAILVIIEIPVAMHIIDVVPALVRDGR